MKKNDCAYRACRARLLKILLMMKFAVICILFPVLQAIALDGSSQLKIDLNLKNKPITSVLKKLESDYELRFVYSDSVALSKHNVDIFAQGASIDYVMQSLLSTTPFGYKKINNDLVVIIGNINYNEVVPITGSITDDKGKPLEGVSVVEKGTTNGTATDKDGRFALSVKDQNAVLVITNIGYTTKEVVIGDATHLEIMLTMEGARLDEVVVVGYGTQKKVNLTGAVSTVSGNDLSLKPVGQTSAALEGVLSGVTVTQRNGKPGGDGGTIRIRGIGTLSGADPLVLIDGAEGSINNIDPNTIASVTVLKDAASASIYGSRAANGVILVTTKRAKNKQLTVNYNNYFGWQSPTELPKLADATTFMELTNEAYINAGRTPLYPDELIAKYRAQGTGNSDSLPNTDWQNLVLSGSGFQQSHFLSVNAGTDKVKLLASVGYFDQLGIVPNTEFKRLSLRSNADIQLSRKLNLQFDLQFINPVTVQPAAGVDGIVSYMNSISPNKLAVNSNGTWGEGWVGLNPLAMAKEGGIAKTTAPWGSINAGINYRPTDWLTLSVNYAPKLVETQGNAFTNVIQTYFPNGSPAYTNPSKNGLTVSHTKEFYNNIRGNITFKKAFGDHNVKIMAGSEANSYDQTYFSAYRDNFVLPDYPVLNTGSADNMNNSGTAESWSLLSFFGRINYDYKEKYLVELNARYDGSSRFGPGNKWGFFPSASAGWRISEEHFFQPLKHTINEFKIRGSWGQLGNQNIAGTYPSVSSVDIGSYSLGGNLVNVAALNGLANGNITWETTEMSNIGLDLSLLSHLSVTADYYVRKTRDILLLLNIPLIAGLDAPYQNAGKVNNKGWDLDVSYNGKAGDLKYNIGLNLSDVKNEVIDMHGINQTGVTVSREGYPINSIYGLQSEGFFRSQDEIDKSPTQYGTLAPGDIKYKDQDGNGIINQNDYIILGNTIPRFTYGAHVDVSWKNFDLNLNLQGVGKVDGMIYGGGLMPFYVTSAGGTVQEMYTDSWTPDNPNARYPRLVFGGSNNQQVSSFWMKNASYLRLKNIQLAYSLPQPVISRLRIQGLRFFVNAYNFFTWDKFWKGYDVETAVGTAGNYPVVKVFTFGLNANF